MKSSQNAIRSIWMSIAFVLCLPGFNAMLRSTLKSRWNVLRHKKSSRDISSQRRQHSPACRISWADKWNNMLWNTGSGIRHHLLFSSAGSSSYSESDSLLRVQSSVTTCSSPIVLHDIIVTICVHIHSYTYTHARTCTCTESLLCAFISMSIQFYFLFCFWVVYLNDCSAKERHHIYLY